MKTRLLCRCFLQIHLQCGPDFIEPHVFKLRKGLGKIKIKELMLEAAKKDCKVSEHV